MDAIAWLTALYIALWVSVYTPSVNTEQPKEQTQQVEQKK
jgi:hypothetical protein